MRITSIATIPVALPFRERYETATGSLRLREMILLKLVGSEGHVGYGDAVPLSLRGGPPLAVVRADLDRVCSPLLTAADLDPDLPPAVAGTSIAPLLDSALGAGAGPGALAAIEMALLDLLGRACDAPAWALLGAADAHPVQCNGTLGAGSPDRVAEGAREMLDQGFETLKIKVGAGEDRARMEAVRDACGAGVKLRIDANGAWSPDDAIDELEALAGVDLELAEQPCATLEDLAALRTRTDVAIVADESVSSEDEAGRAVELEACDAVTIKLAKVGGPRAALRIGSRVPAYLSSALDSPLGIAAAVHTAQALRARDFASGLAQGLATSGLFADNVADDRALRGPTIHPPTGPGLGVEIDEDAVERLRIP